MANIVFVHGWGSGTFVWDEMINSFADHNCHQVNLGFVGDENLSIPFDNFIGIGHSLGGSWLLKHHSDKMEKFISIASFNCFYKYIPQQILSAMKTNIVKDTSKQLSEFWHHAGLDQPGGFKNLNPPKLVEGLSWLSKWDNETPENLDILALAAKDDNIVPTDMTTGCWQDHKIIWTEEGGHMLPLTQTEWCIKHIQEFINE